MVFDTVESAYYTRTVTSKGPTVVALTGGVDSATAAAIMVDQGRDVVGITMRLYNAEGTASSSGGRCCGPRDIEDARRVCAHLGIPHYVVDFEEEFTKRVVDDFVDSYLAGETPNPCVKCNQYIKFTPLLSHARALGSETLVTGHYARIEKGDDGEMQLRRGVDNGKDQSYFLFSMPSHELPSIEFPLGGLEKGEVRRLAKKYQLPNAEKAESHEVCFVPDGDYSGFVKRSALVRGKKSPESGSFVDNDGSVLGSHSGYHQFTLGQRKGIPNVRAGKTNYVTKIVPEKNLVVIGDSTDAGRNKLQVGQIQWFTNPPESECELSVQIRHRSPALKARVMAEGKMATVDFIEDTPVAAPGQAAVFYRDDRVVGGGWITREST